MHIILKKYLVRCLKAEDIAWPRGCQGDGVVDTPKTGVNNPELKHEFTI